MGERGPGRQLGLRDAHLAAGLCGPVHVTRRTKQRMRSIPLDFSCCDAQAFPSGNMETGPLTRFDLLHMQRLPLVPISVPPPGPAHGVAKRLRSGFPFRDAEVRIPPPLIEPDLPRRRATPNCIW